jgi:hypothetical protein
MSGKKKAPGSELAALNKKKLRSTDVSPACGCRACDQLPDLEGPKSSAIALSLHAGDPDQDQTARGSRAGGAGSAEVRDGRVLAAAAVAALAAGCLPARWGLPEAAGRPACRLTLCYTSACYTQLVHQPVPQFCPPPAPPRPAAPTPVQDAGGAQPAASLPRSGGQGGRRGAG